MTIAQSQTTDGNNVNKKVRSKNRTCRVQFRNAAERTKWRAIVEQARGKRGRKPAHINKSYDYSFIKTCKVLNISTEVFGRALKLYKSQKQGNVKLFDLMQKYKLHLEDKDLEDRVGFVRRVFDY